MSPVRFNGLFQFPNITADDKKQVEKIVKIQLNRYKDRSDLFGEKPATTIHWQEGDTLNIATSRHKKVLGFINVNEHPDMLDYFIKSSLNAENAVRQATIANEKENAAKENRPEKEMPVEIQFSFKR